MPIQHLRIDNKGAVGVREPPMRNGPIPLVMDQAASPVKQIHSACGTP